MFVQSLVQLSRRCGDTLVKTFGGSKARHPASVVEHAVAQLESRKVPAAVIAGNLQIVGSNRADYVQVDDISVNGRAMVQVNQNGYIQRFFRSSVPGEIRFFGNAGNDSFDYLGTLDCYLSGGSGNDYLVGDAGWDYIVGGDGNDILEGWAGNDDIYGGNGHDLLDGGSGSDYLFGQAGNDLLGGGSGDDLLNGGWGYDVAFGGSGWDDFVEVGNDPGGYLVFPILTRFGVQRWGAGVQDFNRADDLIIS